MFQAHVVIMERTKELIFTKERIKTDAMLYKEKAGLLIPPLNEENRFHALCTSSLTRFFISSTSLEGLDRMKFFFYRLYDAITEDSELPLEKYSSRFVLANSWTIRHEHESYYPRFAKNLFDLPEVMEDVSFLYTVVIRSSKKLLSKRLAFNFMTMISSTSDYNTARLRDYLTQETIAMRGEIKWKLRIPRKPYMVDNALKDPFNLVNFVRIPSEHDVIS